MLDGLNVAVHAEAPVDRLQHDYTYPTFHRTIQAALGALRLTAPRPWRRTRCQAAAHHGGPQPGLSRRSATSLAALDLCFVVAVAQASTSLHGALTGGTTPPASCASRGLLHHLVGVDELHLIRLRLRPGRRPVPGDSAGPDHRLPGPSPARAARSRTGSARHHPRLRSDGAHGAGRTRLRAALSDPARRGLRCASPPGYGASVAGRGCSSSSGAGAAARRRGDDRGPSRPFRMGAVRRDDALQTRTIAERYELFTLIVLWPVCRGRRRCCRSALPIRHHHRFAVRAGGRWPARWPTRCGWRHSARPCAAPCWPRRTASRPCACRRSRRLRARAGDGPSSMRSRNRRARLLRTSGSGIRSRSRGRPPTPRGPSAFAGPAVRAGCRPGRSWMSRGRNSV